MQSRPNGQLSSLSLLVTRSEMPSSSSLGRRVQASKKHSFKEPSLVSRSSNFTWRFIFLIMSYISHHLPFSSVDLKKKIFSSFFICFIANTGQCLNFFTIKHKNQVFSESYRPIGLKFWHIIFMVPAKAYTKNFFVKWTRD